MITASMTTFYRNGECENNSLTESGHRAIQSSQNAEHTNSRICCLSFHVPIFLMRYTATCTLPQRIPSSSGHAVSHARFVSRPIINLLDIPQHVSVDYPFLVATFVAVGGRSKHTRPQPSTYCLTASSHCVQHAPQNSTLSRDTMLSPPLSLLHAYAHDEVALVCLCVCVRFCQNSSFQCCNEVCRRANNQSPKSKHKPVPVRREVSSAASVVRSRDLISSKPSGDQGGKHASPPIRNASEAGNRMQVGPIRGVK